MQSDGGHPLTAALRPTAAAHRRCAVVLLIVFIDVIQNNDFAIVIQLWHSSSSLAVHFVPDAGAYKNTDADSKSASVSHLVI